MNSPETLPLAIFSNNNRMTDDLSKECRRLDDSYLKWYRKHFNEVCQSNELEIIFKLVLEDEEKKKNQLLNLAQD